MENYYFKRYHKLIGRLCSAYQNDSNEVPSLILVLSNLHKEAEKISAQEEVDVKALKVKRIEFHVPWNNNA
jgi:hypothetical protein